MQTRLATIAFYVSAASAFALAAGVATLPVPPSLARAQTYPTRPVRIIVGAPAGGGIDINARLIAQVLSERLAQQFFVENRPGASGNIGTEAVVNAAPDGYTLLLTSVPNAVSVTVYEKLNFNFMRDIVSVAGISRVPLVMSVSPSLPVRTVPDFIAQAKMNPGKLSMASSGNGSTEHVAGELFKVMTGVDLLHVPYRGAAPALTDLIAGQVQVMFATMPASVQYVKAGNLRALAVTAATRSEALPDISAVTEFVPGYEASNWYGIGVPKKTPAEIIEKLNKQINAALSDTKLKARLADIGADPMPMSPQQFEKFVADETEKWAKVVKFAGIKAE
jgi:tripartite-type tricarboxylate transporter receptor subunit TctC